MARPKIDEERKEQILEAFETLVLEKGLQKTTLSDVARASGLPRPLVRHFIGNRDDMTTRLMERMIDRGMRDLQEALAKKDQPALCDMLDQLFEKTFYDEQINAIVMELWNEAINDPKTRTGLKDLYTNACTVLVDQMANENIGPSDEARFDAALAISSLAYGDASFKEIGLCPFNNSNPRHIADWIIQGLAAQT